MLKQIFNIIKNPYIVPKRLNRTRFINKSMLNHALLLLISLLLLAMIFAINLTNGDAGTPIKQSLSAFISLVSSLYSIIYLITYWKLNIARLHDINYQGTWSILLIIPVLNDIIRLILSIAPGIKGTNKFGDQPVSENKSMVILAIINAILISSLSIIGIIFFIYAYSVGAIIPK